MGTAVVTGLLVAFAATAHAAPRYAATMLRPPGAISTEARAINRHGQIVGNLRTADGSYLAFVHDQGVDALIDIPGAAEIQANAINASGEIAGCAWFESGGRAFVYRHGAVELVPAVNGSYRPVCATGINDAGYVVGHQTHDFQYSVPPSFRYFESNIENIPQSVVAINNRGDLAGTSYYHTLPPHAWAVIEGKGVSPVPPESVESYAIAMNDNGDVIALGANAYLYSNGKVAPVPSLDGAVSVRVAGLNNLGNLVGAAYVGTSEARAIVYSEGRWHDLNSLVVRGLDGVELTKAVAINDAGVVVAHRCGSGPPYPVPCEAFRLDPLPDAGDPATVPSLSYAALASLMLLVAACGGLARRR